MISATSSTTKLGDKRSYVKVAQAVWFINLVVPTCANYKLSYASNKFAQLDPASQKRLRLQGNVRASACACRGMFVQAFALAGGCSCKRLRLQGDVRASACACRGMFVQALALAGGCPCKRLRLQGNVRASACACRGLVL